MPSAHITFDFTSDKVADRVTKMRSSAVRDLFSAATSADVISLSGGMPDVSLLPQAAIQKAVEAACNDKRT
ncbi:MAG: PLP-dependent aminotransferase family protein, partial [Coriobacteriaceae bacterium]|nr:PLP-dependent aminotransferase family protein [Coriobacteriaceae bacterium]